jgi:hypothetical protein
MDSSDFVFKLFLLGQSLTGGELEDPVDDDLALSLAWENHKKFPFVSLFPSVAE